LELEDFEFHKCYRRRHRVLTTVVRRRYTDVLGLAFHKRHLSPRPVMPMPMRVPESAPRLQGDSIPQEHETRRMAVVGEWSQEPT